MIFERTPRKTIFISLVPLIDVSIFLLIFFMLAGSIQKFEVIQVQPPASQTSKQMGEGHIVVLLGRHDEIIINDEIMDMVAMQALLSSDLKDHPHKVVTVKADATVAANKVIDVMDAIKIAGGKNLSIVTQAVDAHAQ